MVENNLDKINWKSAENIAKDINITAGNVRILLNKLVNKWKTVERKKELINKNWRYSYRLI